MIRTLETTEGRKTVRDRHPPRVQPTGITRPGLGGARIESGVVTDVCARINAPVLVGRACARHPRCDAEDRYELVPLVALEELPQVRRSTATRHHSGTLRPRASMLCDACVGARSGRRRRARAPTHSGRLSKPRDRREAHAPRVAHDRTAPRPAAAPPGTRARSRPGHPRRGPRRRTRAGGRRVPDQIFSRVASRIFSIA